MKHKILIFDDNHKDCQELENILEKDYEIEATESTQDVLTILLDVDSRISALLMDIKIPTQDIFFLLKQMKYLKLLSKIPVLMISGEHSVAVEKKCFEMGVSDFITEPFAPALVRKRVKNAVELFIYKTQLEHKVEKQTCTLKNQLKILQKQAKKLQESNDKIIEILGTVVECRNLESGEHIKRVKAFTEILATQLMKIYPEYELTDKKIRMIVAASTLHDIGKIVIPDKILLKPGRYTKEEFEYMKSHTTRGCDMLYIIGDIWNDEYQQASYEICRYHHERYDGKGYPEGLSGDDIPISAQIVSVADVYDALVFERLYKNAYPPEVAFDMIINGECGVFSPKIMNCFRMVKDKFEALVEVS